MSEEPRKLSFQQRARSLPHKHFYWVSLFWAVMLWLVIACTITAGIAFALNGNRNNAYLLIGLVFTGIVVWLLGYVSRKKASCPLCKGTPLLDSQASKHIKAFRLFPLNYGTTNILRAMITRRIRCHFCGTPFDMLKSNIHLKTEHPPYESAEDNPSRP